ncbi:hypothetical protein ACH5RR_022374 [Cinchona calisaya]|uniref:N-acetyltransferase domain-containing protein n=1 Tax=Cinchona calisaya TaxID=153742 RepID=A0ABD2Z7M2_9GENT
MSIDTLFSFHKESEIFLQRMMSLFVASHCKNSPNDLQLMADAPAHHPFVVLGPVDESKNILPDIFCVLQVCLEGQISRDSALQCLHKGHLPSRDQIPWKFYEEFEDTEFPSLSGVRVVRIAVHPSALTQGYGSAALDQLTRYYEGQLSHISEIDIERNMETKLPEKVTEAAEKDVWEALGLGVGLWGFREGIAPSPRAFLSFSEWPLHKHIYLQVSLLEETVSPRENLPPLLVDLQERLPERVDYIGASFGLTGDLFRFWKKHKFSPFYICDIPNNMTGEHSSMVLKSLETSEMEGSKTKVRASSIVELSRTGLQACQAMSQCGCPMLMKLIISSDDLKWLEAYTNNRKEYMKVRDMVPLLAQCYFQEKLPVTLSYLQASILLCMGLQLHDVELLPHDISVEEDLDDGAKKVREKMNQKH